MSKAAELAALIGSQTALSNRNLIINGAMQVAQRGTSVTGKTDLAYHTVDRWQSVGSGSTYSQSQQAITLGDSTVGDFKYFLRHEVTTANDFAGILYKIEDVQSVPEGIVTLSFYAKGTNPGGGSLQLRGRQNFGSGGSPSSEVIQTAQTLTLTSSWQRFTYQITVPSISGKTLGTDANTSYYRIDIQQPGADDTTDAWTLDITGVQLEVGEQATPFEHRSYGDELRRCQRYFRKVVDGADTSTFMNFHAWSAAYCIGALNLGGPMRATPTMSVSSFGHFLMRSGGTDRTATSFNFAQASKSGFVRVETGSGGGLTTGFGAWLKADNASAYLYADAEL